MRPILLSMALLAIFATIPPIYASETAVDKCRSELIEIAARENGFDPDDLNWAVRDNQIKRIESWIPDRLHDQASSILQIICEEGKKEWPIVNIQNDNYRDFGFSFPGVNAASQYCLTEINKRYSKDMIHPDVLDLGAGHGLMTWKMLIAGAHVTTIENQQPTAILQQEAILKAKPFLLEPLKSVCKRMLANVLNFDKCTAYQKQYDFTWSGNLIHFFTPEQATAYVSNLYKITKSGGGAFATVRTCPSHESIATAFIKRKNQNMEFPGYFMVNRVSPIIQVYADEKYSYRRLPYELSYASENCNGSLPNEIRNGLFGNDGVSNKEYVFDITIDENKRISSYKVANHFTLHCFDKSTLKILFKNAGFIVEDVFYINQHGRRIETELTIAPANVFSVGINAVKPKD